MDIDGARPHFHKRSTELYYVLDGAGTLGIAEVTPTGGLALRAEIPTAKGAHCVVADQSGNAYVCDPAAGRILVVPDAVVPAP